MPLPTQTVQVGQQLRLGLNDHATTPPTPVNAVGRLVAWSLGGLASQIQFEDSDGSLIPGNSREFTAADDNPDGGVFIRCLMPGSYVVTGMIRIGSTDYNFTRNLYAQPGPVAIKPEVSVAVS